VKAGCACPCAGGFSDILHGTQVWFMQLDCMNANEDIHIDKIFFETAYEI
jgi:hypothetical protein